VGRKERGPRPNDASGCVSAGSGATYQRRTGHGPAI